jgi:hypothetical protein
MIIVECHPATCNSAASLVLKRVFMGSLIGGIAETQRCRIIAEHNIISDGNQYGLY